MIVVDFSQICLATLLVDPSTADNEEFVRHKVLNSLRSINSKFRREYGEMVIACDATNVWRKKVFPYYKANRRKTQSESSLDWNAIFEAFNKILSEIRENLPYRFIRVDTAEADDIIATLAKHFSPQGPVLIVSGDKDFRQLQKYNNVEQYSPRDKKKIRVDDAHAFLVEHIIRGDSSDGVPNIFSDDDSLVNVDKRQSQCTKKRFDSVYEEAIKGRLPDDEKIKRNYIRNNEVINLDLIPDNIVKEVLEQYKNVTIPPRSGLLNYFIAKKLKKLMTNLTDF
jgi:5'-3' exonuclease